MNFKVSLPSLGKMNLRFLNWDYIASVGLSLNNIELSTLKLLSYSVGCRCEMKSDYQKHEYRTSSRVKGPVSHLSVRY
jgi:hypothetical protein